MGGSLLNPATTNDLENSAILATTFSGKTPINGSIADFDVEKAAKEQESRAGHTGNWFLDAIDNIAGFSDEIAAKFGAGFVGAFEGILDLGATAIGALGEWTGWYDSDPFKKWAEQDIGTALSEWTKTYWNLNPWTLIKNATNGTYANQEFWEDMWTGAKDILDSAFFASTTLKDYREDADKWYAYNDEVLQDMGQFGEFLGGAAHSIGFMLPTIMTAGAAGAAGAPSAVAKGLSLAQMGLSAAGKGSEEALNEGATASKALGYGVATGAIEVAGELVVGKALGVVGLGTGKIMGVIGEGATKNAVKLGSNAFIKELGKTMFEEGMEEVFSAVLEPVTKAIYKGKDAFKNTYTNPDWWFGTNGHFNESVLGQFASGAFVGGLSGAVNTAPAYKKLGKTNYNTMTAFSQLVEADSQMAKMESQKGFDSNSKAYQNLVNDRAKAMNSFIECLDESMRKSSESQNKYLAELLTNERAFKKAVSESGVDVNKYLENIKSDYGTHEKGIVRSFFNEMQARYGTDYDVQYLSSEEIIKQYGEQAKGAKGFFVNNKVVLNENTLNTEAGRVLAHEYFAHGLSQKMSAGNVRAIFGDLIKTKEGQTIVEQLKTAKDSEGNLVYPEFKKSTMSDIKLQEEVLGHYLERMFTGKNLATQLNNIKKTMTNSKFGRFIDNVLDAFNKTEKFKSNKLLEEYADTLNNWLKYGENSNSLTAKTIRKIVYKQFNDIELNSYEKGIQQKYGKIIDILESQIGEQIVGEMSRLETAPAFSKALDIQEQRILASLKGNTEINFSLMDRYIVDELSKIKATAPNRNVMTVFSKVYKGDILSKYLKAEKPFVSNSLHMHKNMNSHPTVDNKFVDGWHNLTEKQYLNAILKMSDPVLIAQNGTDLLVLTKATNSDGSPILVAIDTEYKHEFDGGTVEAYRIKTVTQKDSINSYIDSLYYKNQVVYDSNKKRSQRNGLTPSSRNNNSVDENTEKVKFSKDIDGETYPVLYDPAGKPFFRSPFTYEGNKYVLLPDLLPAFPKQSTFKGRFIEAFSGSAIVSANVNYTNQVANEINPYIYGLQKIFKEQSTSEITKYIFDTIEKYQIRTQKGFDNFKKMFNDTKPENRNPLDLFILQKASSSGSLLWFDENNNYKGNFTRANFLNNKSLVKEEISKYHNGLQNVELTNKDAIEIINEAKSGDFIYVDPPYSNTNATYNQSWTNDDDMRLMQALDEAAERGVGFALSNVFEYNGKENVVWKEWAKKYQAQHIDKKYFKGNADEVLIKHKGEYASDEIDRKYNWYEFNKNEIKRYTKVAEEVYQDSKIYSGEWGNSLNGLLHRKTNERIKTIKQIYNGEVSIFDETATGYIALHHFYEFLDSIQKEGKVQILDKNGLLKQAYWTPEMLLLQEEYKKLGGSELEFNLNKDLTYIGEYNSLTDRIRFSLYNLAYRSNSALKTIRHERTHYFQWNEPKFYNEYYEKPMDELFRHNSGLLEDLRVNDPHGLQYYNDALRILKSGSSEDIKEDINYWRKRRGLSAYSEEDFNNMFIEDIAMEYSRNLIYDEILADSFAAMKRVADVYNKYGIKYAELNELSNQFRDAINKRYNTKIMFSKPIDTKEMELKKKHGLTFKSIRTTEEIVADSADYIENALGKGYKVHFPDNYRNFSSKAFTEINGVKRLQTQVKHLANILLDTQITQNNRVVGTLEDFLDPTAKADLETAVENIISSAPDTAARTRATLPFEKALDRAIRNVQDNRTREGRNHVWQNLRNSVHNTYERYLDLTDDSVAKGGYQPLLNIFNETHWNGTSAYKLGTLRQTVETALELYTEDSIKNNFGGLQYSPEIHDALLDLEASLPARQTYTDKTGAVRTRDVSLDDNAIQKLIDLGRLVRQQIKNQIVRDATEIRPAVREGIKTIQAMSYSQRKGLAARMYRMWKRGFSPAYAVLEQMLGSNSTLARKVTFEMQMGLNQRQLYKGQYSDLINKKLKELKIKKDFDTRTFVIDGHKMSADQALSLYVSLQVDINREEINNNGYQYILTESGKEMKLSAKFGVGQADALKSAVEKALPENYKKFGDFLLETMNGSVKSEYMEMYEKKFGKYAGRNEIGVVGDKSYWMLFRSYQKATNVEKAMKNPVGVFSHAKARVDTQNAVLINGALSSFMSYIDSLGSELYVKPIYRDVISILNTKSERGVSGKTISQVLAETVGEKDFNYLMTTLADTLGVNPNKTNDMFSKAISTFSVAKLSLNIGTMLKQFASIWTSNIPMYRSIKGVFSNIFKSAEVKSEYLALVDEIGGLKYRESSKGVLLSNADSIGKLGEKIAKVGMFGISKVDLFTVSSGVVSLMHIAQDQFGYKIGTEENKNWVKEHWTEFELSQIGNSALSKNAIARGDFGGITKAIFGFLQGANRAAFGSQIHKLNLWLRNRSIDIKSLREQLKTAKDNYKYANDEYRLNPDDEDVRENYINAKAEYDRLQNQMKDYESYQVAGGKAIPVNAALGLFAQGLFVSLINELMKHIKGRKDWDEWDMQDISLWALNILKTTFVDWLPFFNAISSALGGSFERDENGNIKIGKGYDIQVPAVEIANQLVDLFNGFKDGKVDWKTIINLLGNMTGIPVSTLLDYVYGALKVFNPEAAEELGVLYGYSKQSLTTALNNYVEKNDYNGAKKTINQIILNQRSGFVSERVLNELTKLYMSGYHALPREYMTAYVNENGQTVYLTAAQITAFKNVYQQSDKAVRDLLNVQEYHSLTQAEQAKLIKKIYDLYYEYAKIKVVGGSGSSKLSNLLALVNGNVNLGNLVAVLNKVSQITENKRKTRKELVVEYINRQTGLSRQEKILVMYLAGYGLNDNNKRTLKSYLASRGANGKDIKTFLGM